jgi:hypothetical protein
VIQITCYLKETETAAFARLTQELLLLALAGIYEAGADLTKSTMNVTLTTSTPS